VELVDRPNSLEFDRRVSIQGYRLALRLCRVVPGLFAAICCPITDSLELPSRCKHLVGLAPLSPIRTKYRTGDGATLQSRAALIPECFLLEANRFTISIAKPMPLAC